MFLKADDLLLLFLAKNFSCPNAGKYEALRITYAVFISGQ